MLCWQFGINHYDFEENDMSKTLWAPWRMNYILGPKSEKCVFCEARFK